MKLTKETLKRIIKEELEATIEEGFFDNVFGRDPNKIGKGPKATDLKFIYNYGREVAENGQPKPGGEEIRRAAEHFCDTGKCSVDFRDALAAFEEGYKEGKYYPREKEEYDDSDPYEYDREAYRDAMSDVGVGVGALSMPKGYRKGSSRGIGRY